MKKKVRGTRMLIFNDLQDLYAVFVNIRSDPGNPKNAEIVKAASDGLKDRNSKGGCNAFRVALRPLGDLGEPYRFVSVDNVYTYFPGILKNPVYYDFLADACDELASVIGSGNLERVEDLADALHNIPILLTDPEMKSLPKQIRKYDLKFYRDKWDKTFLRFYDKL